MTELRLYDKGGRQVERVFDVVEETATLADGRVRFNVRKGAVMRSSVIRDAPTPEPEPTPDPIPEPVPEPAPSGMTLAELLTADMTGFSEEPPELPSYYDWAQHPVKRGFPPGGFAAFTLWGVLDNVKGSSNQPGRVQIASAEAWVKVNGVWKVLQSDGGKVLAGANYADDYQNTTLNGGQTTSVYGGTSAGAIPGGHNFHFYPNASRASTAGMQAFVVVIRARLEPGTFDAASPPKLVLCASIDKWLTTTNPYVEGGGSNADMGIGKFKRVEKDMRVYTVSNGDLSTLPPVSVAASELR